MTASIPDTALTHGGRFHADDVFSAALLKLLNPSVQIIRVFDVPENFDGLVFDIGWGRFDHHQKNAPVRPNGVPYAAFGLLWKEFGAGWSAPRRPNGSIFISSSRSTSTTTPAAAARLPG